MKAILEVLQVNKKQAIAYAQVTLNFMQSSKYNNEINPEMLGIEMRQVFRMYPNNIIEDIAKAQIDSQKIKKK